MVDSKYRDAGGSIPQGGQTAELRAIVGMTKIARDNAVKLGLNFEAYLLEMAMTSLAEQLDKAESTDKS